MHQPHNHTGKLPLDQIEAFVAVATAGSFSAAAERLNISHSSLSRKVAYLETWMGARLLDRTAQGTRLTEVGIGHFTRFRNALEMIKPNFTKTFGNEADQRVQISLVASFAAIWLFPRHQTLLGRTGGINVKYNFDRRPTDFTDGTDLAIRYGTGFWPGTRAAKLTSEGSQAISCRQIALELGFTASASDLLRYPLLHLVSETGWTAWFERHGIQYKRRPIDHIYDDQLVLVFAAQNSMGIALSGVCTQYFIANRSLYVLNSETILTDKAFYLLRPTQRPLSGAASRYSIELLRMIGQDNSAIEAFLDN